MDTDAVHARFRAVLDAPTGPAFRAALVKAVTDIPALLAELDRLWTLLAAARMRYANLHAAARATLAAHRDGEDDPLSYLRDELPARGTR